MNLAIDANPISARSNSVILLEKIVILIINSGRNHRIQFSSVPVLSSISWSVSNLLAIPELHVISTYSDWLPCLHGCIQCNIYFRYVHYTWEIKPMLYKCVRFYETGISVPMFQSVFKHRYAHHSTVEYTRFIGSWLRYHLYNSVVDHVVYFTRFLQRYTTGDRDEARVHNSEPLGTPVCIDKNPASKR